MGNPKDQDKGSALMDILSPARDLVKNWEVNLSGILESYLLELCTSDDDPDCLSKVNFIHAAMVVHRSAGIYSKKVEYLWLVLMELLSSFHVKRPSNGKAGATRKKSVIEGERDDECFKSIDPIGEKALDNQTWKPPLSGFKFDPVFIPELEHSCPTKKRIDLYDNLQELLCSKSDFRLNCPISSACMLEDDMSVMADGAGVSDTLQKALCRALTSNDETNATALEVENLPENNHVDEDEHLDRDCPTPGLDQSESEFPAVRHANSGRPREEVVTVIDPWIPVEMKDLSVKLLKKRGTYKIPCELGLLKPDRKRKLDEAHKIEELKVLSEFLAADMIKLGFGRKGLPSLPRFRIDFVNEFRDKKKREEKRRLEEIEELRQQLASDFAGDFHGFEDYELSSGEDEGFPGYPDEMSGDEPEDDGFDDADNVPARGEVDPPILDNGGSKGLDRMLYETVVQEKVNACISMGEQLVQSDLAKRVNQWHETIRPILCAAEERGHFDIHEYGTRILNSFPQGHAKTTIPFADIVDGKPKEDVSRYFLATLMLANTYNVEISKSDPRELAVDCMELTLLKSVRHHEDLEDYQAPSQLSRRSR